MGTLHCNSQGFEKITTIDQFLSSSNLSGCIVINLDFSETSVDWGSREYTGSLFLGCTFNGCDAEIEISRKGGHVFPKLTGLPYDPYRASLYSPQTLFLSVDGKGCNDDMRIANHYKKTGGHAPNIIEALSRRLHDYSINEALIEHVLSGRNGQPQATVGFMGGHEEPRDSAHYATCARLSQAMANAGFTVVTGGGPGIMEAANLGAYMSAYPRQCLEDALTIMGKAPTQTSDGLDSEYMQAALTVRRLYPSQVTSLSIPTWFYAHEQNNLFASHVAKYFANSLREEGLTSLCRDGMVFFPGGPGTLQELFMDVNNNFYDTGFFPRNAIVLFDRQFFSGGQAGDCPAWQMLSFFKAKLPDFAKLLLITDDINECVKFLAANRSNQSIVEPGHSAERCDQPLASG